MILIEKIFRIKSKIKGLTNFFYIDAYARAQQVYKDFMGSKTLFPIFLVPETA